MRKPISWAIAIAAIALAASCRSAPPPAPATETPSAPTQAAPATTTPATTTPAAPSTTTPSTTTPAAAAPAAAAPAQAAPAASVPLPEAELARARALKQKADAYELAKHAPEEYAAASGDLQSGEEKYGKDNAASKASLNKAIAGFEAVIAKGGGAVVAQLQERCAASKKAADDLKASVAVKDEYARALEVYDAAIRAKNAGDLEQAGLGFDRAATMFDAVAATAQEKRERALEAVRGVVRDFVAADQKAQQAQEALAKEGFSAEGEVR